MSDPRTVVTVEIAGEEYTIRSEATPDYTRRCAAYVDEAVSKIVDQGSLVEAHKAAVLAALSLTDELFQAQEEVRSLREQITRRADKLAADIRTATRSEDLASHP